MIRPIVMLDDDPYKSIEALYDIDVIGFPIAISQTLLSAWHRIKPGTFSKMLNLIDGDDIWLDWVLASKGNYEDLWNYGMDIMDEHTHRFGSRATVPYRHGSFATMTRLQSVPDLPQLGLMSPYPGKGREGYKSKGNFFKHTYREVPEWLK